MRGVPVGTLSGAVALRLLDCRRLPEPQGWKDLRPGPRVKLRPQLIRPIGAEGLNRRPPVGSCRLFLGPGFRLGACCNRLVKTVKTRKKRGKTGKKWARYGLKRVNKGQEGSTGADPARCFGHKLTRTLLSARCKNCGFVDDASNQVRFNPILIRF